MKYILWEHWVAAWLDWKRQQHISLLGKEAYNSKQSFCLDDPAWKKMSPSSWSLHSMPAFFLIVVHWRYSDFVYSRNSSSCQFPYYAALRNVCVPYTRLSPVWEWEDLVYWIYVTILTWDPGMSHRLFLKGMSWQRNERPCDPKSYTVVMRQMDVIILLINIHYWFRQFYYVWQKFISYIHLSPFPQTVLVSS